MSLLDDLRSNNRKAGGSHLTIQARDGHVRGFAAWCKENNFQIQRADQIKEKHIKGFMESLKDNNSERTRQNKLAALRVIIRESGKTKFADGIKTCNMGVQRASRNGTKAALNNEQYLKLSAAVSAIDQGCGLAVELCRELGLRRQEALMADARTLKRWISRLEGDRKVDVIRGTKGGRYRDSMPTNKQRALDVVRRAYSYAKSNGGFLVKTDNLEKSLRRFSNVCVRAGMTGEQAPHSLRYTYAAERMENLQKNEYSVREAAAIVSQDLGHGDGRIDFVLQVYSKT